MGTCRSLLVVVVVAAGCGEPAYYPALAEAVDTGFDEVALVCGGAGTPLAQTVEIRNTVDRSVRVNLVDAQCVETQLTTLQPLEWRSFVLTDQDALTAYVDLPEGAVRIAARAPVQGLETSAWVIP